MDFLVPETMNPIPIKDFLRSNIGFSLTIGEKSNCQETY